MNTKQLTEDWFASNAMAAFAAVLLISQVLEMSGGTVEFLTFKLPDLSWLIILGTMAFLFVVSLILDVASVVPKYQKFAFNLAETVSVGLGFLNCVGFTFGWIMAVLNMPLNQPWPWILFGGGVFFYCVPLL